LIAKTGITAAALKVCLAFGNNYGHFSDLRS
jgi:hypothetical protein